MSNDRAPERRWASPEELAVRAAVRHALADLPAGSLVLVACSGGPDSVALAGAAGFVAPRAGLRCGAVVVDHGLQEGSAQVAARTADWLRTLADPVELASVHVDPAEPGGPEAAARAARYTALEQAAARTGAAGVLLGHTREDQAETVLLRLARGSGARSLAGMAPVRGIYRRPLLGLARADVRAAVPPGAPVWEDPHNVHRGYARVRVRLDVLPALAAAVGPGAVAALARTADLLRADADALDGWAAERYGALRDADGLALDGLAALPEAVRRRVLRRAAIDAGAPGGDLSAEHVAALDDLVVRWRGQGPPALPGPLTAERRCGRLWFGRAPD